MMLYDPDGEPLLRSDEAFRLAWDCKFLGKPFPGFHVGPILPHLPHAKQLVKANHPDRAHLEPFLALGDEEYERAQSQQYRLSEVQSSLERGLTGGKITGWFRENAEANFRIISSREWGEEERLLDRLRDVISQGCRAQPFVPLLGLDEGALRRWVFADRMPNEPRTAFIERRKRGAPSKADYAWVLTEAKRMKEANQLQAYKSLAALTRELSRELSRRYRHLTKDANASKPNTIEKHLRHELSAILRE